MARPEKGTRTYTLARGTPSRSAIAGAESQAINDRRRAVSASDEVSSAQADAQGVRSRRPSRGRTKKVAPTAARMMNATGAATGGRPSGGGKAIPGQILLAIGQHEADEGPGERGVL